MLSVSMRTSVVGVSLALALLVIVAGGPALVRYTVVVWFFSAVPGLAVNGVLRIPDPTAEWALAVTVSLAIDVVVATVLLYAGWWSPVVGFSSIAALTAAVTLWASDRERAHRRSAG